MNDPADRQADTLVLEYEFDEPPEKVWRAVSDPGLRAKWLPEAVADGEPAATVPGAELRYRMQDDTPPFLASVVSFAVAPRAGGGTRLTIVHRLADQRRDERPPAANGNRTTVMRAA